MRHHAPVTVKLRTFAPQVAMTALGTAAATGAAAVTSTVAIVPLVCVASAAGLVLLVTAIAKALNILDHGWPEFAHVCVECAVANRELAEARKELEETRRALVELKIQ